MTDTPENQVEQIHQAIATLEAQRALLGEAVVNTALVGLRQQLAALKAQPVMPSSELRAA